MNFILILFVIFLILLDFCIFSNKENYKLELEKFHNSLIEKYKKSKKPFEYSFDIPIFYLNMDKSVDRYLHISNQINFYCLSNVYRICAIDGKQILNHFSIGNKSFMFTNNYLCTNSELGCLLSHVKAVYLAFKMGLEYVLIAEDDISFTLVPFWTTNLKEVISQAPKDWNCISLFSFQSWNAIQDYEPLTDKYDSCVAYIVNRKGMENLLSAIFINNHFVFDKNTMYNKIEADRFLYYHFGKSYVYTKECLFYPYTNKSTIHTDHEHYQVSNTVKTLRKQLNLQRI